MAKPRTTHTPNLAKLPAEPVQIDSGTLHLRRVDKGIMVVINNAESSMIDLVDPTYLEFEYMQHMTILAESWRPAPAPIDALHLGGGACTLARAWAHLRPRSRNKVVEIDEKLSVLVRQWFDLPSSPKVSIRVGDARQVSEQIRDQSYDVIVRDVFSGSTTPAQISSLEATQQYARILKSDGIFLANVASTPNQDQASREISTIAKCFPEVIAIAAPKVAKGQRRGNIVVAGSRRPWDSQEIEIALRKCPLPVGLVGKKIMHNWTITEPITDPPAKPAQQST